MSFHTPENELAGSPYTITVITPGSSSGARTVGITGWPSGWTSFPKIVTAVRTGNIVAAYEATGYSAGNLTLSGVFDGYTDAALQSGDTLELRPTKAAITELQTVLNGLGTASTHASTDFAQVVNNLSDLASASAARTNLGLGSAATQASSAFDAAGAASAAQAAAEAASDPVGSAAAAQSAAEAASCLRASNLSDVASASTARTNLGLGTASTHAAGDFALVANNLSDLASAGTARTNLGLGTSATHAATDFVSAVATETANTVLAGPTTGSAAAPTFRVLVSADMPASVVLTSGSYSNPAWITSISGAIVSGNISGDAANVTGTVAIANGGTGQGTAANAINALLPTQTGQTGKFLTSNGTVSSWGTPAGGGGSPGGSSGDIQWDSSGSFAGGGPTWDGSNVLAITTTAAQMQVGQDSTHYSRWTRSSTLNAAVLKNKINQPAASPYSLACGATGYVTMASGISFADSTAFTLSFWANIPATGVLVLLGGTSNYLSTLSSGAWYVSANGSTVNVSFAPSVNTWYHYAVTRDTGNNLTWYSNGSSIGTATAVGITTLNTIGALSDGSFSAINCLIDDVQVWTRCLSSGEVSTLAGGGEPSTTSLVLHYTFNEGTGTTANDTSGSGDTGTLHSPAGWSTSVPSQNPSPPSSVLVEAQVVKSQDGVVSGESGTHTFGDPAGHTVLQCGTWIDLGTGALSTSAAVGFPTLPTCAGAPSGAPSATSGMTPVVIDTTNGKLWAYYGGAWHYVALT